MLVFICCFCLTEDWYTKRDHRRGKGRTIKWQEKQRWRVWESGYHPGELYEPTFILYINAYTLFICVCITQDLLWIKTDTVHFSLTLCLALTFSLPHTHPLPRRLSESFNISHHMAVLPCHPLFYWHTSIWDELLPTSCLLTLAGPSSPAATQTPASVSTDPG